MPFCFKQEYRSSVKSVLSPLKLRNTSCAHLGVEDEDGKDEVKAMREMDELEP